MSKTMTKAEFTELVSLARPENEEDWGSPRQIYLENLVYYTLESSLTPGEFEKFEEWANKATADERLDEALRLFERG